MLAVGICLVTIANPLRHIANHVIQAKRVSFKTTDGKGFLPDKSIICDIWIDFISPRKSLCRSGLCRIFPFGFSGQTIGFISSRAQPDCIGPRVIPGDIDGWFLAASPAAIIRDICATAATSCAGIPLVERYFEFTYCEWIRDRDL